MSILINKIKNCRFNLLVKSKQKGGKSSESEIHFHDTAKGIVIGDNSTVTMRFVEERQHVVPFLAPAESLHPLVGRETLLYDLKQQILSSSFTGLLALYGPPGIGKTALALTLAYNKTIREYFSDGVLWTTLRNSPELLQILGNWLASLGVHMQLINEIETCRERMEMLQATIGARRMLLIIDDVREAREALYFKVGGPHSVHLLTTRKFEIARNFTENPERCYFLRKLPLENSLQLIEYFAPNIVKEYPKAIEELIQKIDGLPSAVSFLGKTLRKANARQDSDHILQTLEKLRITIQNDKFSSLIL